MRIVMMGSGPFAVPAFEALVESSHVVASVATRPARVSRGRRQPPPHPVRVAAEAHGLPIFDPEDINADASHDWLRAQRADLYVVCDFGQILSADTLAISRLGGVNLHGSLLPKYRGAAPVNWAIYHGEPQTGVSVIHMTPHLDAGPILTTRVADIGPRETAGELEERLSRLGVGAVLEAVDMLEQWDGASPLGAVQQRSQATKAPRLRKQDGRVDWSRTAQQIVDHVRAFHPWPGVFTHVKRGDQSIRLILQEVSTAPIPDDATPGTVASVDRKHLVAATGEGGLSLDKVQPAGKRVMDVAEFLCGHPLKVGDRLGD